MPWFKVDDGFWGHPKRLSCPLSAVGLWVTAGSWSAQQMTDGHVPRHVLAVLGGKPKDAAALVTAGLWATTPSGWRFHDWQDMQPTRAQTEARRAEDAERKRQARAEKAARAAERRAGVQPESEPRPDGRPQDVRPESALPDPTRPDPTRSTSGVGFGEDPDVELPASPDHVEERPDPADEAAVARQLRAVLEGWPETDPDELRRLA